MKINSFVETGRFALQSALPIIRKPHDGYRGESVPESDEPSLTKQEFADECDIRVIMARIKKGNYRELNFDKPPQYPEFREVPHTDLLTAQLQLKDAAEAFNTLPARIRDRFGNNPLEMLKFLQVVENRKEAQDLGLIAADPIPESVVIDKLAASLADKIAKPAAAQK